MVEPSLSRLASEVDIVPKRCMADSRRSSNEIAPCRDWYESPVVLSVKTNVEGGVAMAPDEAKSRLIGCAFSRLVRSC